MSGDATEGEEEDVMAAQRKNEWALNIFFHSRRLERCGSRIFGSLKRREEKRRCKDSPTLLLPDEPRSFAE